MQSQVNPSTYAPSGEPPRRRPIWLYVLGGCGGCALLVTVVVGIMAASFFGDISKTMGPVTKPAIQQSLGADVPLYPNGTLDTQGTQGALFSLRMMEKVMRKQPGSMFKGAAAIRTKDDAGKVLDYYDDTLGKAGWKVARTQDSGFQEQKVFRKGKEVVIVQIQTQAGQQIVTLMRGGPELANRRSRRTGPGGNATIEVSPAPTKTK